MEWTIVLSILAGILAVYYYLSRKGTNEFQQRGIPYAHDYSLLRRIWVIFVRTKSFAHHLCEVYNVHPDAKYVGTFNFNKSIVMIRDLELIKSVTIKNFDAFQDHLFFGNETQDPLFGTNLFALRGDKWRDIRVLLSPAFTASKMKAMFPLISECAVNFSEYVTSVPADKRVMEMKDIFTRYANDVIATCAFGINVDSMRDPENEFLNFGKNATNFGLIPLIKILLYQHSPSLIRLFNLKIIDDRTTKFFVNLVADTMRIREEKGITRPDLIQLLIESKSKREPGRELTIMNMTSQAFIFFLAGFETSSTLMSFAAHEIATNPDVQEKLRNEIDKVLEVTNGQPSYEAINGMKYLNAVISEALRKYPPQAMTDRLCVKDFELPPALPGAKPYLVKEGMLLYIPFYPLQHDPKYFPEPDKFKPERFLDAGDQCNLNAYYPFGVGPRMCIGNRFALLETRALLFHLLARCQLKPCAKTSTSAKLQKGGFSMRLEGGFWLSIVPRKDQHPTIIEANQSSRCQTPQ
ncbi:PREDICTED: cytochrome P450 9e2-like [Vollenhovia emeryi]|uniref:cytochrome P450 9e2-like n=1 Tax=Vollenhovia emeryi TaxID=411798 RepID=UPI0005F56F17|nr:PREDICTED: cytochrome P450 9e2-like [Vollenhovia emeryi]XP_011865319.1 PREDICTED: cytochrome P450 9e2-like [Vollenhovia emeryi]